MRIITKNGAGIPYEPMVFDIEPARAWSKEKGGYECYQVVARSAYCDIGRIVVAECETRGDALRVIARMAHAASTNGTAIPCLNDAVRQEFELLNKGK